MDSTSSSSSSGGLHSSLHVNQRLVRVASPSRNNTSSRELNLVLFGIWETSSIINLSDHLPISFVLAASPVRVVQSPSKVACDCSLPLCPTCNWSKAEQCNIDEYWTLIAASLPCFSQDLVRCCVPNCSKHNETLDSYSLQFIKCIVDSAHLSIPCHSRPPGRTLAGWKYGPKQLRSQANFWHRGFDIELFNLPKFCAQL